MAIADPDSAESRQEPPASGELSTGIGTSAPDRCTDFGKRHLTSSGSGTAKDTVSHRPWREELEHEIERNWARLAEHGNELRCNLSDRSVFVLDDAIHWLSEAPMASVQAIVTDPPYGLVEYSRKNLQKKQQGRGGVWRIPPSFDGACRSPVPRFTVLSDDDMARLHSFFNAFMVKRRSPEDPPGHTGGSP